MDAMWLWAGTMPDSSLELLGPGFASSPQTVTEITPCSAVPEPGALAQSGDRAVMDARTRILVRAPGAAAIIDAYFAAPVLDI